MSVDRFTATLHKAEFFTGEKTEDGYIPRRYFFYLNTRNGDSLAFDIGLYVGFENIAKPDLQLHPVPYYEHGKCVHPDDIIRDFALIESFLSALNKERKASGCSLDVHIEGVTPIIEFDHPYYR